MTLWRTFRRKATWKKVQSFLWDNISFTLKKKCWNVLFFPSPGFILRMSTYRLVLFQGKRKIQQHYLCQKLWFAVKCEACDVHACANSLKALICEHAFLNKNDAGLQPSRAAHTPGVKPVTGSYVSALRAAGWNQSWPEVKGYGSICCTKYVIHVSTTLWGWGAATVIVTHRKTVNTLWKLESLKQHFHTHSSLTLPWCRVSGLGLLQGGRRSRSILGSGLYKSLYFCRTFSPPV